MDGQLGCQVNLCLTIKVLNQPTQRLKIQINIISIIEGLNQSALNN